MRKILQILMLTLMTLMTSAGAQEHQKAIIIFDASGSMWGQIDGIPKITIARNALKNVVREWNPSIELGLTVYGHRRKGDCNDIQNIVPIGPVDKNRIINSVMSISPKGKTPISRSLKQAADALKYTEEKTTVILISDGKETCDPDPCSTAKELKKQGIGFVAHVIGFNVDKATDKQLQCIADATGGEYFSAKNADALNKAMKTIVKKVEKPKKLEYNLQITASETKDSPKVEALHYIYKEGSKRYTQVCESKKDDPCLEHVAPGKYNIVTSYHHYKVKTPVEVISEANLTKVNVITGQTGEAKIFASETNGGKWVKSFHMIYKNVDGKKGENTITSCDSGKREPCLKRLPVGKYIAESSYGKYRTFTPFEIKANKTTDVAVIFKQTGKVEVTASEDEGGKLIKAHCKAYKVTDGEIDDSSWDYLGTNKRKARAKRLQVGKYILKCKYNEYKKEIPFEIKAGETTKVHVVFGQTGKVYVSASEKEGGKWLNANCYIYNENKSRHWNIYPRKDKESSMWYKQLPVGKYTLDCEYNAFKKKDIPFEIKAGETTKVHVVFGQTGKVFVSASETDGGKWINANCNIYDEAKDKSWVVYPRKYKSASMSQRQLPVGKYYLNCSYNNFEKEDIPFEIKAGKTTKVHVVFAPFHISAEGINPCAIVHHEVLGTDGSVVAEADKPAKKGVSFVLPDGTYFVESSIGDLKKKNKIIIGSSNASEKLVVDFGGEESKGSVEGVWKTSEGKATLKLSGAKVTGTYSSDNGEIVGEMTYPRRLEGFWIEDNSNQKCSEAKNGRYYWGKIVWTFDEDMCTFKGKWSYCNDRPNRNWSGNYIQPLPKEETHQELIDADSTDSKPKEVVQENTAKSSTQTKAPATLNIGDKVIKIEGMSDEEIKKLQEMQKMLQMFGGMMQGNGANTQKQTEQKKQNDKVFEKMSEELDAEMFTK